jgi:hypothetical protein
MKKETKSVGKVTPPPSAKEEFNVKNYVKDHATEAAVFFAKESFDLFDTDKSGSIDCKGRFRIN